MSSLTPEAITVAFYDSAGTKYGFTWQTEDSGSPVLEYTDTEDIGFLRAKKVRANASLAAGGMYKNTAVANLPAPGSKILYRVGDGSGIFSNPAILNVPKNDPHRSSFLIFSDTQDDQNLGDWWKAALDDAASVYPDFDFIVHGGDIVQTSISREEWKQMLGKTAEYTRSYPMAAAVGNHDYWTGYLEGLRGTFSNHFHIDLPPQNTESGIYYSVRRGNALICVLSSGDAEKTGGRLLDTQSSWLEAELSASSARWKTVVIHNPLYSPGKYGSRAVISKPCMELRAQLSPIFEKYGVDMVISGHDHMFARTYPVGKACVPFTDCGTACGRIAGRRAELFESPKMPIHFIPACAGNQNRGIEDPHTPEQLAFFREMREMQYGEVAYAAVEADDSCLNVLFRVININDRKCVFESSFGVKK